MKTQISRLIVPALVGFLASCGGGSGSAPVPSSVPDLPPPSFAELEQQTVSLFQNYTLQDINDPAVLPVTGSVIYTGGMQLENLSGGFQLAGQMQLNVDFMTDSLSGNVRNLVDTQETRYNGMITIGVGQIDRMTVPANNERTFSAPLTGNVASNMGAINVDGTMEGYFLGPDQESAAGFVTGTFASSTESASLTGGFIGTR
ncbi:MAG: hypothetical protein II336_09655 [Loktanella sp.]|nr:hypothetical protein [Loktanella sp.]